MSKQQDYNKSSLERNGTTNLNILIPISLKKEFKSVCAMQGKQFSVLLREFIGRYTKRHTVN